VASDDPEAMMVHSLQGTFRLRGVDLDESVHGRVVEFQGVRDGQDEAVFHVESYDLVPYAVLRGRLRVEELCKMVCNDWLLFDAQQSGEVTTFALTWDRSKYPGLWELQGSRVTLAGDVFGERNWLGLFGLRVRFRCD
jgi:hypothetical protein